MSKHTDFHNGIINAVDDDGESYQVSIRRVMLSQSLPCLICGSPQAEYLLVSDAMEPGNQNGQCQGCLVHEFNVRNDPTSMESFEIGGVLI